MTTHRQRATPWDIYDRVVPPWDIGRPQPALLELAEAGTLAGRVLDVGCGTGEHALMAAALGLEATGVDSAPSAIALASAKALERGLAARFLVHDVMQLAELDEGFDTVIDCGLFHLFDDADRARYVEALASVVTTGGRFHMLCFSNRQIGIDGPRRITPSEIRESFVARWHVDAIEMANLETTQGEPHILAWRASLTRRRGTVTT